MNELKRELIELLNMHNLTLSEFDELINFMQNIKHNAILSFEFNDDSISKIEQCATSVTTCVTDTFAKPNETLLSRIVPSVIVEKY